MQKVQQPNSIYQKTLYIHNLQFVVHKDHSWLETIEAAVQYIQQQGILYPRHRPSIHYLRSCKF